MSGQVEYLSQRYSFCYLYLHRSSPLSRYHHLVVCIIFISNTYQGDYILYRYLT